MKADERHTYLQILEPPRPQRRRRPSAIDPNCWQLSFFVATSRTNKPRVRPSAQPQMYWEIHARIYAARTAWNLSTLLFSCPNFGSSLLEEEGRMREEGRGEREGETFKRISPLKLFSAFSVLFHIGIAIFTRNITL